MTNATIRVLRLVAYLFISELIPKNARLNVINVIIEVETDDD